MAAPGVGQLPVSEAVAVALTESEAVRHGGGSRRLGSADLESPVPQYLVEPLCEGGLPDRRGLVPPEPHLGLHLSFTSHGG